MAIYIKLIWGTSGTMNSPMDYYRLIDFFNVKRKYDVRDYFDLF